MTSISRSQEPWISDRIRYITLGKKKYDLSLLSQMVKELCCMTNASVLDSSEDLKSMGFL